LYTRTKTFQFATLHRALLTFPQWAAFSRLVRLPEPFFSLLIALVVALLLLVLWNCLYFRSL
jgi:hypothetical protein